MPATPPARFASMILSIGMCAMVAAPAVATNIVSGLFGPGATSGKLAKHYATLATDIDAGSITWSPDGRFIAVAGNTGGGKKPPGIEVWDVAAKQLVKKFEYRWATPASAGNYIAWSPTGTLLAACASGREGETGTASLLVWDVKRWEVVHELSRENLQAACSSIDFSFNGEYLAVAGRGTSAVSIFSTRDWRRTGFWKPPRGYHSYAFSIASIRFRPATTELFLVAHGYFVASKGGTEGGTRLLRWKVGESEPGLGAPTFPAVEGLSLAFSADARHIAVGKLKSNGSFATAESVLFVNADTGELESQPERRPGSHLGSCPAYSSHGKYLIIPYEQEDGLVRILDASTHQVLDEFHGVDYNSSGAISRDSAYFAAAERLHVVIWKLQAGVTVQADITTDRRRVIEFCLSPVVNHLHEA